MPICWSLFSPSGGDADDVGVVDVLLPVLTGSTSLVVEVSLLIGVDEYQLEMKKDLENIQKRYF